ncbi:hypothetical protein AMECASPLE_024130 [Ameca splendens]|uniref:Uncharacterized protein n=1 Tax=Ameca splendens TaxID=208324 RepID=A0ABV0ZP55_9TELE
MSVTFVPSGCTEFCNRRELRNTSENHCHLTQFVTTSKCKLKLYHANQKSYIKASLGQKQRGIERMNGCLRVQEVACFACWQGFVSLEGGQRFLLGLGSSECDSDPETWNLGRFQLTLGRGGKRPGNSIQVTEAS